MATHNFYMIQIMSKSKQNSDVHYEIVSLCYEIMRQHPTKGQFAKHSIKFNN